MGTARYFQETVVTYVDSTGGYRKSHSRVLRSSRGARLTEEISIEKNNGVMLSRTQGK